MKQTITTFVVFLILLGCSSEKQSKQAPQNTEQTQIQNQSQIKFKFRSNGTFKIVQITDTHFSLGSSEEEKRFVCGQIAKTLDSEKPDMVIFTGDNITSCNTKELWQQLLVPIDERKIPFAVAYGNHDREEELSDFDLPQCFVHHPTNVNTLTDGYLDDIAVEIKSANGNETAAVLYIMDSGDYSPVETYWDYGWITHDQIHWYVEKSRAYAAANDNLPVPSYAFFHIPPMEYKSAYDTKLICGHRGEKECPGELNSGILSAFEENGDVHAIFVGHDHDNDYVAQMGGVALVYGRCCFYKEEGRIPTNGIRVIELTEGDYGFRTWVREATDTVNNIKYDVPIDFALRKASTAEGKEHGLTRTLYTEVGDIHTIETTAVKGETKIVPTPRMIGDMGDKDYGSVHEGFLYIPETGAWSLHVSANDAGIVTIDDITFRDTDYGRGQRKMYLEKGFHPIKILTKTNKGGCWLKLMWRKQSQARYHEIPAEYYYVK